MKVLIVLMMAGSITFFIPKKKLRTYFIIASIGISLIYFFFNPPMDYDLYRHYSLLETIHNYSLKDLLSVNSHSNRLLNDYSNSTPIYLIFAYVIGHIEVKNLLPVVAGSLIFGFTSRIIINSVDDTEKSMNSWKIALCFCFLLALADFRSVSGIRNMMAYAIFSYILYLDLVRKSNVRFCFIVYLILAGIHSSIYLFIVIRLLIELCKFIPAWFIGVILVSAYSFLNIILFILQRASHISVVTIILTQINKYAFGSITNYNVRNVIIRAIIMMIYGAIYLYDRFVIGIPKQYQKLGIFFMFSFLFTFGSVAQYDLFIRNDLLLLFTILPFLLYFLKYAIGSTPNIVLANRNSLRGVMAVTIYIFIIGAIFISLIFYTRYFYLPMDAYFVF